MKRKINIFSILLATSFLLFVACQKENIYEGINNKAVQKTDPLIALDRIMDTPVVMGKVVLDNNDQFKSGWILDTKAKLHQFQLEATASFPTKSTSKSALLLETILKNTTELEQVDATTLMQKARTLEEIGHTPAVYRAGETDVNTAIYFYFANVSNTTCEASNGQPISYITNVGCDTDASNLSNCTSETSITTMMIHAEGKKEVSLPYDLGQPLVNYMNSIVKEHEEAN